MAKAPITPKTVVKKAKPAKVSGVSAKEASIRAPYGKAGMARKAPAC
jgi:hypothetical protein